MPFGVPIFWVSSLLVLFNCCRFVPSALRNNLIGGGSTHLKKCDVIVVTIRPFSGKETKRMAVPDPSSCGFFPLYNKV